MDRLDLAILREAGRGTVTGWGNRDPRVSTNVIAERLGVPRSTVGARIRAWRLGGFLLGYDLVPNPTLFGARMVGVLLRVPDPARRDTIPGDLSLVDGVFACMEHLDGWYEVACFAQNEAARERIAKLLGRLNGVEWASPPMPCEVPRTMVELSAADYALIAALRQDPLQTLKGAAETLGVGERTVRRRYERLLEGEAVWLVPTIDFTKWDGGAIVHFAAALHPDADVAACAREMATILPEHLRVNETAKEAIEAQERFLEYFVHLGEPAGAEYLARRIAAVPGVAQTQVLFPVRLTTFPHWLDEQLALRRGARPVARRVEAPRVAVRARPRSKTR